MWKYLVRIILRNRLANLIIIFSLTGFMLYEATQVKLSYTNYKVLPESDSTFIAYRTFKTLFGEDGSVMFIAVQDKDIYTLDRFNKWYDITYYLKDIEGVEEVLSIARIYQLKKNDSTEAINFLPVLKEKPSSQAELDSIRDIILSMPFYDNFLYNRSSHVTMMMVTLDKDILNTKKRVNIIREIKNKADEYGLMFNEEVHFSGLPYIRTVTAKKLENELIYFIFIAAFIASVILLVFFRSFRAVAIPGLIMGMTVIWVLGTMSIFGYKITMLTGILPPLIIVIVVENCIFLLNKYYDEYRSHKNKVKALSRVVMRIGNANLLTNTTTAAGFAAFTVTGNKILTEFGIIASLNILFAYIFTLFLIPIFFSYLPPPKKRHIRHLEMGPTNFLIGRIVKFIQRRQGIVYIVTFILLAVGIFGMTKLETTGRIVDDISRKDKLYKDLIFLEDHFNGVMPLEIMINTREKNGVFRDNARTLYKIKRLQKLFIKDTVLRPYFSRSLSIVDGISFIYQAHRGGDPKYYILPPPSNLNELKEYTTRTDDRKAFHSFIDSANQVTRVSIQMANVGTKEIEWIKDYLTPKIAEIFPEEDYEVTLTGTSVVFLKGSKYLVKNLVSSLILALIVISVLMALLFTSFRMIVISLIPNLIPQIMTAALMGYIGIPIKPSTILIFSIALGISVDNAIHFLSRYRLQLTLNNWNIRVSVFAALKETGFSMLFSSVVLFFGFAIFILSSFGGTEALGYLVSFTLLIALLSNLFLLPTLLLTLDRFVTTRTFKGPLLDIFEEEEDIEVDKLEIENSDDNGNTDHQKKD